VGEEWGDGNSLALIYALPTNNATRVLVGDGACAAAILICYKSPSTQTTNEQLKININTPVPASGAIEDDKLISPSPLLQYCTNARGHLQPYAHDQLSNVIQPIIAQELQSPFS